MIMEVLSMAIMLMSHCDTHTAIWEAAFGFMAFHLLNSFFCSSDSTITLNKTM